MDILLNEGTIEVKVKPVREMFFNEDDYYGIYACDVNPQQRNLVKINSYRNISIKGYTPKLDIGTEYIAIVKEEKNARYEGSYSLESIRQERPKTVKEQRTFLESILTTNQVDNIYKIYGEEEDVIGLIEKDKFDYSDIKGLGEKTFKKIQEKIKVNIDMSEALVFLSKFGIKYNMISKLVSEYKNSQIVIQKIQDNPYLLTEVKGIGFTKADEIAKSIGHALDSPHRVNSCLKYLIEKENRDGHSWINYKQLLNKTIQELGISKQIIIDCIEANPKGIRRIDDRFTTNEIWEAENKVAKKMISIKSESTNLFKTSELDEFIDEYCEENNVELEENQRQFFHDWNENSIVMLVGGGGMGKSWLMKILLKLINKKRLTSTLLAPTGKASRVMSNYTGENALTIHRKVGMNKRTTDNIKYIDEEIIIVDEASMCDIFILSKFFEAITNKNARILFVGDDFQLPSVGVGNFLYDVLNGNQIKISKLKKVFRQAEGGILNVSTDIRLGKKFLNYTDEGRMLFGKDCVFWLVDSDFIFDGIISNYKKAIKKFNPEEVVILTPTNKGKLGTVHLNKEIQKIANPQSPSKKERIVGKKGFETIFRVGDAVMNIVNSYDVDVVGGGTAEIFNGDTGVIVDIDEEEKVFIVNIDDILVKININEVLTTLSHSWVTTIHKSQGSQYDVVILVADSSMTYQLNANLLYTGASRAKKYELVLTQAKTVNTAMNKFANMKRRSFLQELLEEYALAS